jgi:CRISPR type III-A-associated RAMP protein Csm4
MKYIKINLNTKSGFSNLLAADQIWGQMVWGISDLEGKDEATKFVDSFEDTPPFILSSMMPLGYFPKIMLPTLNKNKDEKLSKSEEANNRRLAKSNKKMDWIPVDLLLKNQKEISNLSLVEIKNKPKITRVNDVRSSIDRETGIPFKEGGLFNQPFLFSENSFVIYVKILKEDDKYEKLINKLVDYFKAVGLGGDRNVGKGNFDMTISNLDKKEQQLFDYEAGNLYTTLSRCSGSDLEPLNYQINVYSGITGGSLTENKTFNKYPVVYFEPGSTFAKGQGSLIHNVHIDSKICSYGYAFPLYLNN